MAEKIYDLIKKRLSSFEKGEIFFTTDFIDIADLPTIRKCLGRQVEDGNIRRILAGVYERPIYSKLLKEYLPTDLEKVAYAFARKFHWSISPSGDVALNKLGLSTQVPAVWSYVSDGPYRNFKIADNTLIFKHKTNREISFMSGISIMVIEALKTLGKSNIDEKVIVTLKKRLSEKNKNILINEATNAPAWIFNFIRRVCE